MKQIINHCRSLFTKIKRLIIAPLMPSNDTLSDSERTFAKFLPFILGLAIVVVSVILRLQMANVFGDRAPFSLLIFAVLFASLYGGLLPGLFTTFLSATAGDYFFIHPTGSFAIENRSDVVLVVVYTAACVALSIGSGRLRAALSKATMSKIENELTMQCGDLASWIYDIKTQETKWSGALEKVYGVQNFTGENWISGVPEPDSTDTTNILLNSINNKLPFETEFRFITPGGKTKWIWTKGGVIYDINGVPIKVHGVNRDITAQVQLEDNLRMAKVEAEAANRAKSAFLANMSHEIRTPLGALLGFSDLLVNEQLSPSEKLNYSAAIKRNGAFLSAVINDILDLSKVESGKFEVEKQSVSLNSILTDISTFLNLQAQEKGLILSVVTEGIVPNSIETDPVRIRQILINIVGNAIKFTDQGFVEVKIRLDSKPGSKPTLAIDVTDSGIGVSPLQATKLFAPFVQADVSTKRTHGGTGLGLVLSKKLANLLGGDVVLSQSELGKGCTFSITIDPGFMKNVLFENNTATTLNLSPLPHPDKASPSLQGIKILLVEDSADNQLLITRFLNLAGASVDTAANGQEALDKVQGTHFDLLLMDLQMPIMDGYEATSELRKKGFQTPIIALTAHALKEERLRCLASGFNEHLCKPVDRKLLIASVALLTKHNSNVSVPSIH